MGADMDLDLNLDMREEIVDVGQGVGKSVEQDICSTEVVAIETEVDAGVEIEVETEAGTADVMPHIINAMSVGDVRFGITAVGEPMGHSHWMCDSSTCGDLIAALPSVITVAGKTANAGVVSVDMGMFIDYIIEGAGRLEGIKGIVEASGLPTWAVSRVMGTFPVLMMVYEEGIDKTMLTVEAAAIKAAIGVKASQTRRKTKTLRDEQGRVTGTEESEDVLEKVLPPDIAASKLLLTSRMKHRYKDNADVQQAVQINIVGAEANL